MVRCHWPRACIHYSMHTRPYLLGLSCIPAKKTTSIFPGIWPGTKLRALQWPRQICCLEMYSCVPGLTIIAYSGVVAGRHPSKDGARGAAFHPPDKAA